MRTDDERLAYLVARLPATFAAASRALGMARQHLLGGGQQTGTPADTKSEGSGASALVAGAVIETMLDLGSGPGTAAWAALEAFPRLRQIRLLEHDPALIRLGRKLAQASAMTALTQAEWICADLNSELADETFDLVIANYALGELSAASQSECLRRAWSRTEKLLVVVEPGTRKGFGHIHRARQELIAAGAKLAAPCPHQLACPMAAAGDWCHFAARVERTAAHRRLKQGELGYEDEKFSYLIASRVDCTAAEMRIVRHPGYHSGWVEFELCSVEGLRRQRIGRSRKQLYRAARKAAWGDAWPPLAEQ
jgi:ribosomal protein RSM22 (predicted rRNA methylase)